MRRHMASTPRGTGSFLSEDTQLHLHSHRILYENIWLQLPFVIFFWMSRFSWIFHMSSFSRISCYARDMDILGNESQVKLHKWQAGVNKIITCLRRADNVDPMGWLYKSFPVLGLSVWLVACARAAFINGCMCSGWVYIRLAALGLPVWLLASARVWSMTSCLCLGRGHTSVNWIQEWKPNHTPSHDKITNLIDESRPSWT